VRARATHPATYTGARIRTERFRGHMVNRCLTAAKKKSAIREEKRRQKLGVSAGDISGLKLSRRGKRVLPGCVLRDPVRLDGRSADRSVGRALAGARMALRSTGVAALVNSPGASAGTR